MNIVLHKGRYIGVRTLRVLCFPPQYRDRVAFFFAEPEAGIWTFFCENNLQWKVDICKMHRKLVYGDHFMRVNGALECAKQIFFFVG